MRKSKLVKGSATVEMAYIMPIVFFAFIAIIYVVFYYHDKNLLNGLAYETAVVGSQRARLDDGNNSGELEGYIKEQTAKKAILLTRVQATVVKDQNFVTVSIKATHKKMRLSVKQRAVIIEPEKYIRNIRKIK